MANYGAVVTPDDSPSAIEMTTIIVEGMPGSEFLIHFDPPSGLVTGIEVAILISRATLENFRLETRNDAAFLDSKIAAGEVQVQLGRVADGRDVGRAVPGCLDAKIFSQDGDLASWRQASGLRHMAADVFDQSSLDQRLPLMRAVK